MRHLSRFFSCLLMVFCVSLPASPLDTPLSDEAVRDAYFLGQRHDASFLGNGGGGANDLGLTWRCALIRLSV